MTHWYRQNRGLILFMLCLGFIRTSIADYNPIPSGSMRPTILEGDVILINRVAYDYKLPFTEKSLWRTGNPKRGDIVTFISPGDGKRLIKRIVAKGGDTVELRDEVLYVNDTAARYDHFVQVVEPTVHKMTLPAVQAAEHSGPSTRVVQFLPSVSALRSFPRIVLAPDTYFMMGDNRDNSGDSRYFGPVSRAAIIGKAHHVLLSVNMLGNWLPRFERTAASLYLAEPRPSAGSL